MATSILVVDRDRQTRESIAESMRPYLVHVLETGDCSEALRLATRSVELALVDTDVIPLSKYWSIRGRRAPSLIVTTSDCSFALAVEALRGGAVDVFERPISVEPIVARITATLESRIASPHYLGRRLDKYVRDNCAQQDMSLSRLSRSFGISNGYASLLLRDGSWGGFRTRLAHHRVKQAKRLLMTTNEPLYTIADRCGFSSASRLSETFGRFVGVTPKRYRELSADSVWEEESG